MKYHYLEFLILRQHEELQGKRGNFVMEQIMEEYGNAILALLAGGVVFRSFFMVLEMVTAF